MLSSEGTSTPTTPTYPTSRVDACCESKWCCGIPRWPLPFWLKAKALTLERAALRLLLIQPASSYMQEGEDPLFHDLPLHTLITWTRWWLWTSKALILVFKKRIWGEVGSFLRDQKGRTDNRIVLLRANWAGRGRELRLLDEIKRSV